MQFIEKIKNYHKASYPALFVTTHEEGRLMQDMLTICEKDKETTIHEWNAQDGLVCRSESIMHPDETKISTDLLKYIQRYSMEDSIFVLNDFHLHFDKVINIRLLRNCWSWLKSKRNMIVFVGHKFSIPAEIQKEVQLLDYSLPDAQAIRERLAFIQSSVNKARAAADKPALKISTETTEAAVEAAKGMTYYELENAFAMAWESAKKFNQDYVKAVFDEKISQLKKNGLLTYLEPDISFDNVGGMQGLKTWLSSRKKAYSKQAQQYGLPLPKGMLLASVPGTGKTLICKAIAKEFDCPLFALDIGSIFDSLVGNSEKNMREAIKTIESIGKCVILID